MSIDSAKQMLIDSRYPVDKVVCLEADSFLMPGSTTNFYRAIPHGLDFTPLCGGNWSTVPDFSIQYEFSSGTFPSSFLGYAFNTTFNIFADSTSIYISGDNLVGSMTIYYRIFGYEPSTSNSLLAPLANEGDDYVVNSRYNYPKEYLNNYVDLPAGGATDSFVYINHGIGTIPQALGWVTYDTYNGSAIVSAVHPVSTTNGDSDGVSLIVGDESIAFVVKAFMSPHRAYYKVYLDS